MKGNLSVTEPEVLARWEEQRLWEKLLEARRGAEPFILHDGPPYANGDIHMGHALNKILKDIIVRYQTMRGKRAPYVPGWDCHGLPIEHALMKELKVTKHQVKVGEFRRQAREYALKYVQIQRDQFKRLGVMGDWDHPYLTLDPGYVAAELRALAQLVTKGYVYRARRPVNWCWSCETALAEAEVEYEQHSSPSVFVKFQVISSPEGARDLAFKNKISRPDGLEMTTYLVIWTTTPWTLMGNVAVAVHPEYEYSVWKMGSETWITASELPANSKTLMGFEQNPPRELKRLRGKELEGLIYRHPFGLREGKVVLADYVTLEEGTGLVHTAPGFGVEDFATGKKHGLEVVAPVDSRGRFAGLPAQVKEFNELQVQKANPAVIQKLQGLGLLVKEQKIQHQYPHCWRCHEPIIFRATAQWFLSVEHEGLRGRLMEVVGGEVRWIPPVGKERMAGMVKTRPDWCLSRQRLWGVPIPALVCKNPQCGGGWLIPEVIENFARAVESAPEAVDRWFTEAYKEWVPKGFQCLDCGGEEFAQGTDILDVWFDSGMSHQGVLRRRKELTHPADLYLEGSDQHRGWFQVSLITGAALEGKAPYRSVLTHGFVVDGQGRKMSKSLGNVMAPQQIISQAGADVLRLWVASSDYAEDVRLSPEILAQVSETYRKIRNTVRFCLSNISDLVEPHQRPDTSSAAGTVPPRSPAGGAEATRGVDRWILSELGLLVEEVTRCYEADAFHRAVKAIHEFCTVRLSNFYLDVVKDILYTAHPNDPGRRSAQRALAEIARALILMLAPVLPVTAEEAWGAIPHKSVPGTEGAIGTRYQEGSVHLQRWPAGDLRKPDPALSEDWGRLLALRDGAMKALEQARSSGLIGDALEARLEVRVRDEQLWNFLQMHREDLEAACIVSGLTLDRAANGEGPDPSFEVQKAAGAKCARCWMRLESVGRAANHPELCHRCVAVVEKL